MQLQNNGLQLSPDVLLSPELIQQALAQLQQLQLQQPPSGISTSQGAAPGSTSAQQQVPNAHNMTSWASGPNQNMAVNQPYNGLAPQLMPSQQSTGSGQTMLVPPPNNQQQLASGLSSAQGSAGISLSLSTPGSGSVGAMPGVSQQQLLELLMAAQQQQLRAGSTQEGSAYNSDMVSLGTTPSGGSLPSGEPHAAWPAVPTSCSAPAVHNSAAHTAPPCSCMYCFKADGSQQSRMAWRSMCCLLARRPWPAGCSHILCSSSALLL